MRSTRGFFVDVREGPFERKGKKRRKGRKGRKGRKRGSGDREHVLHQGKKRKNSIGRALLEVRPKREENANPSFVVCVYGFIGPSCYYDLGFFRS